MKVNKIILLIFTIISPVILFAKLPYNYNYGITDNKKSISTIYITVDLCPSSKSDYSKELFKEFIKLSKSRSQTIPIGVSVSGLWILSHQEALKEIQKIEKDGFIKITWINHGYTHYYNPNLEYGDNFLLHNQSEAEKDIKKNNDLMVKYKLTPSNFIRFPGLISNKYLENLFEKNGYKILGASAWLAKTNGKFKGGDIILVHGNKNEEYGVKLFINNVKNGNFNNYKFGSLEDFNK